MDIVKKWQSWAPYFLSILRIMSAFLFIPSGTMKLFAFPVGMPAGAPPLQVGSQMWIGAILELVGGALLLLGLFTHPVAFILSGMMAVAYWQFHSPAGFWPVVNKGAPAAMFCFVFLYLSAAGAGPWSVDALMDKNRKRV